MSWLIVSAIDAEPLVATRRRALDRDRYAALARIAMERDWLRAERATLAVGGMSRRALEELTVGAAAHDVEVRSVGDGYPLDDHDELAKELGAEGARVVSLARLLAPLGHSWVSVAGAVREPAVVLARTGATPAELVELAGGPAVDHWVALDGGPIRGRLIDHEAPLGAEIEAMTILPHVHPLVIARRPLPTARVSREVLRLGLGLASYADPL
ncbi:MAG TPA: SLBB domain-containing protein [Gemmatimonadales bacterium]|nr:SLBB domain-containing protein [Gemmatimonadales bacterium]